MSRLENRINNYLTLCFRSLREDFLSNFEQILTETDCIDAEVNAFLTDLREIFSADLPGLQHSDRLLEVAVSTLGLFKSPLSSANRRASLPSPSEIDDLRQEQLSIGLLTPHLKDAFRAAFDDIVKDCSELQHLEAKEKKAAAKLEAHLQTVAEKNAILETDRTRHKIESQTVSDLRQTVDEFLKMLSTGDDPFLADDVEEESITIKIRSALAQLKRAAEVSLQRYVRRVGTVRRSLRGDVDEAASVRDLAAFSHQKFMHALAEAQRAPAMPIVALAADESSVSPLVDSVRDRLREIRARREANLQSSASFLKAVRKEEKRRIRSEASSH
jgi:hypothetical protein